MVLLALAGLLLFTDVLGEAGGLADSGILPISKTRQAQPAEQVGVEVYDLSLYEESSRAYAEALAQMEEDWFPRQAVVMPKGPEGGEGYPNAPLPIYDAIPVRCSREP